MLLKIYDFTPEKVFDLLVPTWDCDAFTLRRLGNDGDGGKWVCGLPQDTHTRHGPCLIYSLGSENDFSFETAVINRAPFCEIHTFDCTVENPRPPNSVIFHPYCISTFDFEKFRALTSVMREHNHGALTILKMDIEMAEFVVLPAFLSELHPSRLPRQILWEIHLLPDSKNPDVRDGKGEGRKQAMKVLDLIMQMDALGYRLALKEPNPRTAQCWELVHVLVDS
eukprot:TRINITY_DN2416_c0_g1_i1.p1 TRINITY_DN2416_c0_g1~~TRINITY_DN2416_c0_g1_i1.p1  ORF type:complete len:224 (+),score=26.44 TRINITY_DN2416_c0_g1_i1:294-965(+)